MLDTSLSQTPKAVSSRKERERPGYSFGKNRTWQEKHREKYLAHKAVANAVKRGKLEPQPCEICGAKAHAHHDDYSKRLEVRWLCHVHHREHHRRLEEAAAVV